MGRKEYDLIRELGHGNWIDEVAGEATLLGYSLVDPLLEARGAELASMVRDIRYDDDRFYLVEAYAKDLSDTISRVRAERSTMFIDSANRDEKYRWPDREWKYELLCVDGKYQIEICLPVFNSDEELKAIMSIEQSIQQTYSDPSFESYVCERKEDVLGFASQKFLFVSYYDQDGSLLRKIIIHQHEEDCSRGFKENYYFMDFSQATKAWKTLKEMVISGRR